MLNKVLTILLIFSFGAINAQDIPIGDWRDHLPYNDAISVTHGNGVTYCATNSAVFMYDKADNTVDRLNLVNGLSDIGFSKIKYNDYNGIVLIGYVNGNVDIIEQNKSITNLSFIKSSSIVASKSINHIYFKGKLAYLSTGFGIVVVDTDKMEIVDTYLFGPSGSFMQTNAVTIDATNIYAATDQGVYFANKNSFSLFDFNQWSLLSDLGTSEYSNILTYSNLVFASLDSPVYNGDTLYYNNSGVWQKFISYGYNSKNINVYQNNLLVSTNYSIIKYNASFANLGTLTTFNGSFSLSPIETAMDEDGFLLIADEKHGLVKTKDNLSGEIITTNGPTSSNVFNMDFSNGHLWFVSGGYHSQTFSPTFIGKNLVNHRNESSWETADPYIYNQYGAIVRDAVSVAINPGIPGQVYMGSWDSGLFEFNNGTISNIFTARNSLLDSTSFGTTKIGGLKFDSGNNLWITNGFANNLLTVKTADNNWYSYSFPGMVDFNNPVTSLIVDQNNYKWMIAPRLNSVLVFDENSTPGDKTDDRAILNGNITGSRIHSLAEDLDGEIWVGTDEGISVFYNPSEVFDESIVAEQIYLQQEGQTQILLATETINVITVDGANRKWIGTQNSGAYLMSEDGTEEVEHFTTDNSPLFSNNIFDIVINPKTGEVFFGTEKGLLSYKGTATDADNDFNNVFVYPNPVKPDFTGTIAIRGLVKDTDVRITDISGNIVYQTTSLGGQAVWDGKDFNGRKVQTGVYMIFNGSPEGDKKAAAKILIYH